ncbi:MAG: hypothetical protein JW934_16785 [Anaerolineae bacterium]|nr:hypothetical protein [Anaerolineae bacterium]
MTQNTTLPKTIIVDDDLIHKLKPAIAAALAYEEATQGKRKLGITGEVGELLACHQLGLELALNPRAEGFDAIDQDGLRVQIKTRRSESEGLAKSTGRTSRFSSHEFDYALLILLDPEYQLCEIWRADYSDLKPIIEKQKRRSPSLSSFKRVAKRVYLKELA